MLGVFANASQTSEICFDGLIIEPLEESFERSSSLCRATLVHCPHYSESARTSKHSTGLCQISAALFCVQRSPRFFSVPRTRCTVPVPDAPVSDNENVYKMQTCTL